MLWNTATAMPLTAGSDTYRSRRQDCGEHWRLIVGHFSWVVLSLDTLLSRGKGLFQMDVVSRELRTTLRNLVTVQPKVGLVRQRRVLENHVSGGMDEKQRRLLRSSQLGSIWAFQSISRYSSGKFTGEEVVQVTREVARDSRRGCLTTCDWWPFSAPRSPPRLLHSSALIRCHQC